MARKKVTGTVKWKDRKHWAWFPFSFTIYTLSDERLYIQKGFFNTHYDETLLYRIVDICLKRSFKQKLFGTGTVVLQTKADTQGTIELQNIKHPLEVQEMFSDVIEQARHQKGVVGREFYSSDRMPKDGEGEHGHFHGPYESPVDDDRDESDGYDFQQDHES